MSDWMSCEEVSPDTYLIYLKDKKKRMQHSKK